LLQKISYKCKALGEDIDQWQGLLCSWRVKP